MLVDDTTEVLQSTEQTSLLLRVRGWPAGQAIVFITLKPWKSATLIRIEEDATDGPASWVPQPARQVAIVPRNRESLRRLAYFAQCSLSRPAP